MAAWSDAVKNVAANVMVADEFVRSMRYFLDIEGWLGKVEGYALLSFAAHGPGAGGIVEIGSFKGRSTCYLAHGARAGGRGKVTAVDHFQGSAEHQRGGVAEVREVVEKGVYFKEFLDNVRAQGLLDWVAPVAASSADARAAWGGAPIRLLFIDGDHTYEGVQRDFALWSGCVEQGGVVAFHDYNNPGHPGATRFCDELLDHGPDYEDLFTVELTKFVLKR